MNKNIIVGGVLAMLLLVAGVFATSDQITQQVRQRFQKPEMNRINGMDKEMQAFHEDIQATFENNDYNAWKVLMEEKAKERYNKELEMITPENFDSQKEIHEAMEAGDMKKVKELREEYGLIGGPKNFGCKGMHRPRTGQQTSKA